LRLLRSSRRDDLVTGHWWLDLLISVAVGLVLVWSVLIGTLAVVRPRGGLLREAMRLLPDVIRLVHRLATDRTLPRGVRIRLGLLLAYLASPIDLTPGLHPRAGLRRRRDRGDPWSFEVSSAEPGWTWCGRRGRAPTTVSPFCAG